MLPITRRRTLEVPHGLAAVAAAVCLILAFATDHASVDERLQARNSDQSPVEETASERDEALETASEKVRDSRKRRERRSGLGLLPWFPGYGGRG